MALERPQSASISVNKKTTVIIDKTPNSNGSRIRDSITICKKPSTIIVKDDNADHFVLFIVFNFKLI